MGTCYRPARTFLAHILLRSGKTRRTRLNSARRYRLAPIVRITLTRQRMLTIEKILFVTVGEDGKLQPYGRTHFTDDWLARARYSRPAGPGGRLMERVSRMPGCRGHNR